MAEDTITDDWQECLKKAPAWVRNVKGEKEQVNTREGITWAYAETDYVMRGKDKNDIWPIKKTTFHESYDLVPYAKSDPDEIQSAD